MSSHLEILEQAEHLTSEGSYRSAINLLQEQGEHDNSVLVQRLIDLRVRAFDQLSWPAPKLDWPPAHDNRYQEVSGFPEVQAADLDVESLKAGILGRGGLIVRGMMDEETQRRNEEGENAHHLYKLRQRERVEARLRRGQFLKASS